MNVELTIQEMFDYFPTLYKERADCLNQLFLTVGNGYKWIDGELVECCESYPIDEHIEKLESHLVDGKAFQHNKMTLRDDRIYYSRARKEDPDYTYPLSHLYSREEFELLEQACIEKTSNTEYYEQPNRRYRWDICKLWKGEEYIDWSPKYIKLLNYPEDIKPDWLAAIKETKALLKEDGLIYDV